MSRHFGSINGMWLSLWRVAADDGSITTRGVPTREVAELMLSGSDCRTQRLFVTTRGQSVWVNVGEDGLV